MPKSNQASSQSVPEITAIAHAIARLVEALGKSSMGEAVIAFLRSQSLFDSALVLVYRQNQRPQVLLDALAHPMRSNDIESYLAGAYLLDPMRTHALTLRNPEVVQLKHLTDEDFRSSEYFRTYYSGSHLSDEVDFLIPIAAEKVVAVCLERSQSLAPFADAEVDRFRSWLPMLSAVLCKHALSSNWPQDAITPTAADSEHNRLEARLATFGSDSLTPREHEVVQHLLSGASAPDIAGRLKVSLQTVRVHRRNIYEKLDVSSLGQLFSLAMRTVLDEHP